MSLLYEGPWREKIRKTQHHQERDAARRRQPLGEAEEDAFAVFRTGESGRVACPMRSRSSAISFCLACFHSSE